MTTPAETICVDFKRLAGMIDVSAVQANQTADDVRRVAETAKRYGCVCAFSLPAFTPLLAEELKTDGRRSVMLGGVVGFPSGGDSTDAKLFQAGELVRLGCDEIDMVMNVGKMRSGMLDDVRGEIAAVKSAIGVLPLKVILECHYLTPNQIAAAARLAVDAGASWVKTGTGWAPTGATLDNVRLLKETVGDRGRVKAAGGVRTLKTVRQMAALGAERFGIGCGTVERLFDELAKETERRL